MTQLAEGRPRLVNLTVRAADWNGTLVFLHEIVAGAADRSYGIQVAKLAGLPAAVVARAKHLLADLEAGDRGTAPGAEGPDGPAVVCRRRRRARSAAGAKADFDRTCSVLALDALDPDELSPRDAMAALYRLKALRADQA